MKQALISLGTLTVLELLPLGFSRVLVTIDAADSRVADITARL